VGGEYCEAQERCKACEDYETVACEDSLNNNGDLTLLRRTVWSTKVFDHPKVCVFRV